jgi:hypothetical protein
VSAQTGEDAPGSAPTNLKVIYSDMQDINIKWDPPDIPNGTLLGYILHMDVEDEDGYKEYELPPHQTTFCE